MHHFFGPKLISCSDNDLYFYFLSSQLCLYLALMLKDVRSNVLNPLHNVREIKENTFKCVAMLTDWKRDVPDSWTRPVE